MKVALIDYGSGNLRSAAKAFEFAATEYELDCEIFLTSNAKEVAAADYIVLPGVGAFGDCMAGLKALPEMVATLKETILIKKRPFIGICVGMQLLATKGFEHGEFEGLGWIAGKVVKMTPQDKTLKVPHMGWNNLTLNHEHPLTKDLATGADVYFVHSYYMECANASDVLATVDYGGKMTAAVVKENIAGVQFHPEKSQKNGITLIKNFLEWQP